MKKWSTERIVVMGLLIALEIVLSRFLSINTPVTKIGFAFVPVAVAGILYGPLEAAVVGGLGDLLGALLFPTGPYFPGFTLTGALTGAVFGFFLYRNRSFVRVAAAVMINQLLLSFLLNTLWISILYGSSYMGNLTLRATQTVVLIPVQLVGIVLIQQALSAWTGRRKS